MVITICRTKAYRSLCSNNWSTHVQKPEHQEAIVGPRNDSRVFMKQDPVLTVKYRNILCKCYRNINFVVAGTSPLSE